MGKKGEQTKQHIREAAYELFAEHGYTKVTMQDICTKAGLSKGGLYRHYEDKPQIFTDILAALQKEEADRENAYMAQDRPAALILEEYFKHLEQDLSKDTPDITIALYEFCVEHKDGIGADILSAQYQRGQKILLSLIEYGVSRGEFHPAAPARAASSILFLVEGVRMVNEVMPVQNRMLADILYQIREILGVHDES